MPSGMLKLHTRTALADPRLDCIGLVCCTCNSGVCDRVLKNTHKLENVTFLWWLSIFKLDKMRSCKWNIETLTVHIVHWYHQKNAKAGVHQGKTSQWLDNRSWAGSTSVPWLFVSSLAIVRGSGRLYTSWEMMVSLRTSSESKLSIQRNNRSSRETKSRRKG
jgi:hypothetical protein